MMDVWLLLNQTHGRTVLPDSVTVIVRALQPPHDSPKFWPDTKPTTKQSVQPNRYNSNTTPQVVWVFSGSALLKAETQMVDPLLQHFIEHTCNVLKQRGGRTTCDG